MKLQDRFANITEVLLRQKSYLSGSSFRLDYIDEAKDIIQVTFDKMTMAQNRQLRERLREYGMEHLKIIIKDLLPDDPNAPKVIPSSKRRKRHRRKK